MDINLLVYVPLVMVFLLEVLAIGVLAAYFSFLAKFQKVDEQYKKLKHEYQKHENEVLGGAQKQADIILSEATKKAEMLVTRASEISKTFGEQFNQKLAAVTDEQLKLFRLVLEASKQETSQTMKQIAQETRSLSVKEIEVLRQRLLEQSQQSQTALSAAIAEAFAKAEGEIEKYKEDRLLYIDNHMASILETVVADILPAEMTLQQQEDLIVAALEEAKKARVFGVDVPPKGKQKER